MLSSLFLPLSRMRYLEQVLDTSSGIPAPDRSVPSRADIQHITEPRLIDPATVDPALVGGPSNTMRKVCADRIKWNFGPTFDAAPFIDDGQLRAVYLDPEVNRTHHTEWPEVPKAKVHCDKANLSFTRNGTRLVPLSCCPSKILIFRSCVDFSLSTRTLSSTDSFSIQLYATPDNGSPPYLPSS